MDKQKDTSLKERLYTIVFKADTPAGKAFDIIIILLIILSIVSINIRSIDGFDPKYYLLAVNLEWVITIIFTFEYILRVLIVEEKRKYMISFYGLIDLFAILPTYLSLLVPGMQYALVLRIFRLLRVFRVLRLGKYIGESYVLWNALKASRYRITVFLEGVLVIVVLVGTLMYLIEGEASGFDSIPHAIYWAIVTLTTVGYGDITPVTPLGRVVASLLMLLGYGVIAVSAGVISAELTRFKGKRVECNNCNALIEKHDDVYCKYCGNEL